MIDKSLQLKFVNYEIVKLNLIKVKSHELNEDTNKNIGFLLKIIPNSNKNFNKVNIIQGVQIQASEDFPYNLEVVLKGNFEIDNCENDDEKIRFLLTNATAIIFPYLRATVSLMSSQLDIEKIILPVMNFSKVLSNTSNEDLILDQAVFENF